MPMIDHQKGITIIEVMVTIVITTVGLLGLNAMQLQSVRSAKDTGNRSQAIWMANDLINRIRANETSDYTTNGQLLCANQPQPVAICATYHDGTNQIKAAECSGEELVTFDQWDVLCGMNVNISGIRPMNSSASYINNPGLVITELPNGDLQMTISWDSRTAGTDANNQQRFAIEEGTQTAVQRESYVTVFRP